MHTLTYRERVLLRGRASQDCQHRTNPLDDITCLQLILAIGTTPWMSFSTLCRIGQPPP